jgi:hypothetical protein
MSALNRISYPIDRMYDGLHATLSDHPVASGYLLVVGGIIGGIIGYWIA